MLTNERKFVARTERKIEQFRIALFLLQYGTVRDLAVK